MAQVSKCTEEDVSAVADLHVKVFYQTNESSTEQLKCYYKDVFFNNPWYDDTLPSLVYRTKQGKIVGFLGVIPRQMILNGTPIRVAIAHRLMVAPDSNSPLAALKMLKGFFSYSYDLAVSDGANDIGKKLWEGMGGSTAYLYSMNWIRPLRPCSYAISLLGKKRGIRPVTITLLPICHLVDAFAARVMRSLLRPVSSHNCIAAEIDEELLLTCIIEFSKGVSLCPQYDSRSLKWLLNFLRSNKHRGTLKGYAVRNNKSQLIGAFLYYLNPRKIMEVMLLTSREGTQSEVLEYIIYHAWNEGAVSLFGRLEPKFLGAFWSSNCLIKRGSWALVHAKDPQLLNIINRGDVFLSTLEGELWLRSPKDRL